MVLDFLKGLFGSEELSPYEQKMLEREHRRIAGEIARKERELSGLPTSRSKKKMNPQIKAALAELDRLKKRQREIEKRLGGKPEGGPPSRRSKRSR